MKAVFISLFALSAWAETESNCSKLQNDCEYYSCISQEKSCSSDSYPLAFGRRFCLRYGANISKFSENGKSWIENVRQCLIREMETFESDLSCSELQNKAFKSHIPCYVKSGFCELSLSDKRKIMQTLWPSLGNPQVISDGMAVLKSCFWATPM
jgi:hypothetical protein